MSAGNKAVVHRWFEEVWNQGIPEAVDELFPSSGVAHGLGDSDLDVNGPAEFKAFVAGLRGTLPDIHFVVEDILAEGDRVAVRIAVEGTHLGDGLGFAPTGGKVCIRGIVIVRVINGQIVEGWNSYDQLGLLRQLGGLPRPGPVDSFLAR